METRELRYFVALAEELHFGRAAARVGIEQSPLSKAIRHLEGQLGVQLFYRTRRSTTLTTVGETFLIDARVILSEIDHAYRNLISAASGRSGRLRIALCEGVAHPRIAKLLAQTREENPGVNMQIIHSSFHDQLRGLHAGEIDIGFGSSASNNRELHSIPLWEDAAVAVIRADDRLAELHSIRKIDTGSLILLSDLIAASSLTDSWINSTVQIEYVGSVELLLTLVAAGYGIGIISASQAETMHRRDLTVLPLNASGVKITTFLLQRSSGVSTIVARFVERAQMMCAAAHESLP